MRRSDQFGQTVKTGVRTGKSTMVVHFATTAENQNAPLVGFVVSKAIGNAVTRNLVKRRLRSIVREHLPRLPSGSTMVVRALPRSAEVEYAKLGQDFAMCMDRAVTQTQSGERN